MTPQVKMATTERVSIPTASQKGQPDSSQRPLRDDTANTVGQTPSQVTTAIFHKGG
ncbi:MAG: hypothetical protein PVF97_02390 [Desulfobacterales bacterium]